MPASQCATSPASPSSPLPTPAVVTSAAAKLRLQTGDSVAETACLGPALGVPVGVGVGFGVLVLVGVGFGVGGLVLVGCGAGVMVLVGPGLGLPLALADGDPDADGDMACILPSHGLNDHGKVLKLGWSLSLSAAAKNLPHIGAG